MLKKFNMLVKVWKLLLWLVRSNFHKGLGVSALNK
jgi:hypothetical protein